MDTWVIRAVYEEVQACVDDVRGDLPIRSDDLLVDDLKIDPEDLDEAIVEAVADRCKRSLDGCESNPRFGEVNTVGDLVHFMNAQPLVSS